MIAACALSYTLAANAGEPNLLKVATPIVHVSGWLEAPVTVGWYLWWKPDSILAFYSGGRTRLLNIGTKRFRDFPTPRVEYGVDSFSPDRKKALVNDYDWRSRKLSWQVKGVPAGKELSAWSITPEDFQPMPGMRTGYPSTSASWSENGRYLFQIEYWTDHSAFSKDAGKDAWKNPERIRITRRDPLSPNRPLTFPVVAGESNSYARVFGEKALLVCSWDDDADPTTLKTREWSLDSPVTTQREWKTKVPAGLNLVQYLPSPKFDPALLVLGLPDASKNKTPYQALSLWFAGLHGENMRELGAIAFTPADYALDMGPYQYFGGVCWNPDNRHVSFIYQRELYMLDTR